ncbi:MAG: hypothetical protein AB7G28_14910 [Pirellulales bacterium]
MQQVKEPRTLKFSVAEVTEMIASLESSKTLRHLSGVQRRQIQETIDDLTYARDAADGGSVSLRKSVLLSSLQCGVMTQKWLSDMLDELF